MTPRLAVLTRFHKRMIYLTISLLWFSGALWFYWQISGQSANDFGSGTHPGQAMIMRIHGAIAMAFLVLIGTLLPLHMRPGWRQGDHRVSGGSVFGTCLLLILTGWGLYYIGDETLRHSISLAHTYVGLALPLVITAHVMLARSRIKHLQH